MTPLGRSIAGVSRQNERFQGSPQLVIYDAAYDCSSSTEGRGTIYEEGGRIWIIQLTVFLRKEILPTQVTADLDTITADSDTVTADDLTAPPRDGVPVTYKNRQYRIHFVTDLGGAYRLRLADRHSDQ